MCINRTDGWSYAIKKLSYFSEKMREKFLQETYALAALETHPNIVRYYSSWEDPITNSIYIQCEWCKGGSLKKQKCELGVKFNQKELCKIIRQSCMALKYMHEMGFSHGDVKPENILVSTKEICERTVYKLGDLGSINESGDGRYLAPELLNCADDKTPPPATLGKADIFSLGMTIFELALENGENLDKRSQITQEDINLPDHYDVEFVELLQWMLQREPDSRPTANHLLFHPLLMDEINLQLQQEQQINLNLKHHIEELEEQIRSLSVRPHKKKYFVPNPLYTDSSPPYSTSSSPSSQATPDHIISSPVSSPSKNGFNHNIIPESPQFVFTSPGAYSPEAFDSSCTPSQTPIQNPLLTESKNYLRINPPSILLDSPVTPSSNYIRRSNQMNIETPNHRIDPRMELTPQTPSFSPAQMFTPPGPSNS
uniref:Protein kinase domain-containing protein n=1 Tax=Arcella intermedia TaxID=1963864 RepID=A0A6B2L303_9EUKA